MYITGAEYNSITDRPQAEATNARIKRASQLLDARIGNYTPNATTGRKLNLDGLSRSREDAVKEWIAQMVAFLYDNGDKAPSAASLSLGRFSVTSHGQKGQILPEELNLADAILVSSGVIRRGVNVK